MIQQLMQQLRNAALQYLHDRNIAPTAIPEGFLDELSDRLQNCESTHELATILLLLPAVQMQQPDRTERWSEELTDLAIQVGTHTY
jgi:hypothetical protein